MTFFPFFPGWNDKKIKNSPYHIFFRPSCWNPKEPPPLDLQHFDVREGRWHSPQARHVKGLVTGIGSSGQPCVDDQLVVPQEKNPPGKHSNISHQSGKPENYGLKHMLVGDMVVLRRVIPVQSESRHMNNVQSPYEIPLYRLIYRDPYYNGWWTSQCNGGSIIPIYSKKPGFWSLLIMI